MIAIRLTKANLHKILNESPIDRRDIEMMIEEYDTPNGAAAIYFVPQSDLAHQLDRGSWMTLPYAYLKDRYDFDMNKINTEFVEITPK